MQQTSWNSRKLKRELRDCEAAVFMNLYIDIRHQFISHNGRAVTSLFIVNIIEAIFKHNETLPYSAFIHYFVSVHLTNLPMNFNSFVVFHQQKPNHRMHFATQGFSIAAHILRFHCEQSRSSTNRTLPQLESYWVRGSSDTKMTALTLPIASPRQNVSYFLDSPRTFYKVIQNMIAQI